MKKIVMVAFLGLAFVLGGCSGNTNNDKDVTKIEDFNIISFAKLDELIAKKETMVIYFGWVENCGDSHAFQDNYLLPHADENDAYKKIYVVDLDQEIPDALSVDRTLREPMTEKYGVEFSPTLIYYVNGEIDTLLEWTPATSDKKTGILASELDVFFQHSNLLK